MTASPTHAEPLTLDPATFHTLISTTVYALPHHPKACPEEIANDQHAAFLVIAALRPRDPLEAMLAARIVVAHAHVMENFRNAAQSDLPPNLQLLFLDRAIGLSRMMDVTLREFWGRQTAPAHQPRGLPASVVPAVHPQPAPEAARTAPPPAPPQADTPQNPDQKTDQKSAPAPRPTAPAPAPQHAKTAPTNPPVASPTGLDPAELAQLLAKVEARLETSSIALAA